jgi:hypothetical protein
LEKARKDCTDSGLRKWIEAVIEKQKQQLASGNNPEEPTQIGILHADSLTQIIVPRRGVESRGVPSASRESGGVAQRSSAVNWNPHSVYNNYDV